MANGQIIRDAINRLRDKPLSERPVVQAALEKIKDNHPIVGALIQGAQATAQNPNTSTKPGDVPAAAADTLTAIVQDPVVRSQMGLEPWWQNRVKVGMYTMGFGMVLKLIKGSETTWWDDNHELITNIIVIFGGGIAAVGEWLSKYLSGIDWKRPLTIIGIGRGVNK